MRRGRPFRVPARALVAHVLHADRTSNGFRQHRRVHDCVVGVVTAVGARPRGPDHTHGIDRHVQGGREALLHEVRLLRTAPAGDFAVLDLDQRAGRPHAGMRLERPFVIRLDHLSGLGEGGIHVAVMLLDLALARRRVANVIVEFGLLRERRLRLRPFHLQRARRLDRIPFLLGDDGQEAFVPDDLRAGDVLD